MSAEHDNQRGKDKNMEVLALSTLCGDNDMTAICPAHS